MGQLAVRIAGRVYRLGCDEGEEARLEELAQVVDHKIADLRLRFGELGDQRLIVMAAIALADECAEANSRTGELEAEVLRLKTAHAAAARGRDSWAEQLAVSIGEAALRIEQAAQDLNDSSRG